jgi:enediyne biosynthesis protein E9
VPVAIDAERCVNAKWCHTGCIFGAKNSLITNYLAAAERLGVQIRTLREVQSVRQSSARPYRYIATVNTLDPDTKQSTGSVELECKALVLATGAMGDAPILMRSSRELPSLSSHVGQHLGSNGDHVAAIEFDPARVHEVLGLGRYHAFHKGMPITTMTYDFWAGRRSHAYDGTRFTLQEIFLSTLTNLLYDDGRAPDGEPSWWGVQKKDAIANWASRIELLAMVEDTNDGTFLGPSVQPNGGPIAVGAFSYAMSEQSLLVREAANAAMAKVAATKGLGRFMKLTETRGVYCAHPLGGCRMAESAELGVVDHSGQVFGYEGLHCFGSSIIPTSLGVNPSLTIAAVAERCADKLVARGPSLGLPAPPADFRPGVPKQIVGPRVIPARH